MLLVSQGAEDDPRAVVELHVGGLARFLLDLDLGEAGDETDLLERLLVLLGPVPALGRAVEVVERDARADDVEERRPLVLEGGLEQRDELLLVARERPATNVAPPMIASMQRSNGGTVFASPVARRRWAWRSAVAENWPLVRP